MLDRRRQPGSRLILSRPEDLELALRLFREDGLMAKREARRKRFFMTPGERRKLKSVQARRRVSKANRKRTE